MAILQFFGILFGTVSVAICAFIQNLVGNASVAILHLVSMDRAHWTYHLPRAFAGIMDVHRMLGELIVSDHGVRSLALLPVYLLNNV
jgi:hypothetical protein